MDSRKITRIDYGGQKYYCGQVLGGLPHGRGRMFFERGISYDGQWKNGIINGIGKMDFPSGNSYVGNFEDNQYSGQGVLTTGGYRYTGEFVDSKKKGRGVITYYNHALYLQYSGEVDDNKFHGEGILKFKSGNEYHGAFYQGKYIGRSYYICSCCDEKIYGYWTIYDTKLSDGIPSKSSPSSDDSCRTRISAFSAME